MMHLGMLIQLKYRAGQADPKCHPLSEHFRTIQSVMSPALLISFHHKEKKYTDQLFQQLKNDVWF